MIKESTDNHENTVVRSVGTKWTNVSEIFETLSRQKSKTFFEQGLWMFESHRMSVGSA